MSEWAVDVAGVSKRFRLHHERNQTMKSAILRRQRGAYEDFWALRDVSFRIRHGEFGIIGGNGSGKSTLLKCLAKILYPESGTISTHGRVAALLEIGSGFHPELSGRDNIFLNAAILGISRAEARRKFDEIVDFSGVEKFIDQPVKNYSSGMYLRLAFSVAINVDPDILLLDEVLAVGDASFQQRCIEKVAELTAEGRTVILVSHSMQSMMSMCTSALWLENGQVRDYGNTREVSERYSDSTRALEHSSADGKKRWGTGEVEVTAVDILNIDGEACDGPLTPGEPLILRLRYLAKERVAEPQFILMVSSISGENLWNTKSDGEGRQGPIDPGQGYVEFFLPTFPFAGDDFMLTAAVKDGPTEVLIDLVRDIARLRAPGHIPTESGHLTLRGTWGNPVHDQVVADPR